MQRRSFTLQLYPGRVPVPLGPIAPQAPPTPDPTWRCTGCLMSWGAYGPTAERGRPGGYGCNYCKDAMWMPDNPGAKEIDEAQGLDPNPCVDLPHPGAGYAMGAVELTIQQGSFKRLTQSCQGSINKAVLIAVGATMKQWIDRHRPGKELWSVMVDFSYRWGATMNVSIHISHPAHRGGGGDERFVVRYRWDQ